MLLEPYETMESIEIDAACYNMELDMPDEDRPLYGKGAAAGWTCEETGVSYVSYLLFWNFGSPPRLSESAAIDALNNYLDALECH